MRGVPKEVSGAACFLDAGLFRFSKLLDVAVHGVLGAMR